MKMNKVIKMPLYRFFHQVFEEVQKKQDDLRKRKIKFLYKEAYRYFLDLYLMKMAEKEIVDLPQFMYETGRIICREAQTKAEQAVLEVIKAKKVDYCYTKRIREIKNL